MSQSASFIYSASLPGKRMAAGCLFLNEVDDVLIVKPIYRSDWLLPGIPPEDWEQTPLSIQMAFYFHGSLDL
jgi:hypothetical protein